MHLRPAGCSSDELPELRLRGPPLLRLQVEELGLVLGSYAYFILFSFLDKIAHGPFAKTAASGHQPFILLTFLVVDLAAHPLDMLHCTRIGIRVDVHVCPALLQAQCC